MIKLIYYALLILAVVGCVWALIQVEVNYRADRRSKIRKQG